MPKFMYPTPPHTPHPHTYITYPHHRLRMLNTMYALKTYYITWVVSSLTVYWCFLFKDTIQSLLVWVSDGSLGSLHLWRSQRIAKYWSCELQDTLALFGLRNTSHTERLRRFAVVYLIVRCSALGWVYVLFTNTSYIPLFRCCLLHCKSH